MIGREIGADLDDDTASHAHVGATRRGARTIDQRSPTNEQLTHVPASPIS